MTYSKEWQDKLNFCNGLRQTMDWETIIDKKFVNLDCPKAAGLVFLDNPVWVEIRRMSGIYSYRKIKAISGHDVYFDGTYEKLGSCLSLGSLVPWSYTVDGHTLDLTGAGEGEDTQQRLIDFVKKYTDGLAPRIPKGILKIPSIIQGATI